jgi:endonuclease-8
LPEGDTIFRAARTLQRAFAGKVVTRFSTVLPHLGRIDEDHPIAGRTVESVVSHGKWLLMKFSGDLTLVTHMRMNGSWHIYRLGERWHRDRNRMRIVIETTDILAVGFDIPVAEFHTPETLKRHPSLTRLGPDVLRAFDAARVTELLLANPDLEVGAALLRQSIMAGLGNVYKSEVCFACGVNPFRKVNTLTHTELDCLLRTADKFMRANISDTPGDQIVTYTGFRRTTGRSDPAARLWVYGRRLTPCRRCGSLIEARKQGTEARVTFWCPRCQPISV